MSNNLLNNFPPKTAFILGLGVGVLGLFTIGFFVLLGLTFGGEGLSLAKKSVTNTRSSPEAQVDDTGDAAAPPSRPSPPPAGNPPPITDKDHIRGSANAKVTLIEYSDLECPFCKRFHPTLQQVIEAYPNDVRWIYRHFPLSFHANAQKEAEASECAADLGGNDKFWEYLDKIFERTTANGTGFALDALVPLAKEIGLNEEKFKECLDTGKYAQTVQDQLDSGAAAGVSGTPGTFIIGSDGKSQLIPGALPFESIKQAIDSVL